MIKGVFNFAPFIFLGTCMSVSLVFYVFLPIKYENLRNEKTHSVYTYFAALFSCKKSA